MCSDCSVDDEMPINVVSKGGFLPDMIHVWCQVVDDLREAGHPDFQERFLDTG